MYEYMRGLQRQFFKEPDFSELRQEINEIHQALAEGKAKPERRSLLKLVTWKQSCGTKPPSPVSPQVSVWPGALSAN